MAYCWRHQTITWTNASLWHSLEGNFTESTQAIIMYAEYENFIFQATAASAQDHQVKFC